MKVSLFFLLLSFYSGAAVFQSKNSVKNTLVQKIRMVFPKASKISVENIYLNLPVPEGATLEDLRPEPPLGSINFSYSWDTPDGIKKAYGNAATRIFLKVAVTKTPMRHGEMFSGENIFFEERELTPYSHTGYFPEGSEIFSLSVQGNIPPHHVVVTSQTALPQIIRSGQIVDLVYETPTIKITARSKALKGGHAGEKIRVENIASKKIVEGRIISSNEVSLH